MSVSYASGASTMKDAPYTKSMFTDRMRIPCTGTFAPNFSEMPSSGWMRRTSAFGSRPADASAGNTRCGAIRNWIAISVERFGSRLPVRT